jgi:hypothetical protein
MWPWPWDLSTFSLFAAEAQEEIILTEATPPTPSPGPSFSPAKSATSVEVPPPSSPVSNPSPEYTGLSTAGKGVGVSPKWWGLQVERDFWEMGLPQNTKGIPELRNLPGLGKGLQASGYL